MLREHTPHAPLSRQPDAHTTCANARLYRSGRAAAAARRSSAEAARAEWVGGRERAICPAQWRGCPYHSETIVSRPISVGKVPLSWLFSKSLLEVRAQRTICRTRMVNAECPETSERSSLARVSS